METAERKKRLKTEAVRFCAMLVACCLYAFGTNCFVIHNSIVGGGATGIATLIYLLTDKRVSIGLMTVAVNLPILALGLKQMGWKFILRCLFTITVLAGFNELFSLAPGLIDDPILGAVYGGILQGAGVGLFIRFKVSSGGTELLARGIQHWFKFFSIPVWDAIFNAVIVVAGALAMHNPENIFYALILIFISAKVGDMVVMGVNKSKLCYIITDKGEELSEFLLSHSPRGITLLEGKGMYTKRDRQVLLTCVKPQQIEPLRSMVKNIDTSAFVIVSDANEVFGKGFSDIEDKY